MAISHRKCLTLIATCTTTARLHLACPPSSAHLCPCLGRFNIREGSTAYFSQSNEERTAQHVARLGRSPQRPSFLISFWTTDDIYMCPYGIMCPLILIRLTYDTCTVGSFLARWRSRAASRNAAVIYSSEGTGDFYAGSTTGGYPRVASSPAVETPSHT